LLYLHAVCVWLSQCDVNGNVFVSASALQYMRSKNVSHMDLKPQNILLSSAASPVLKIAGLYHNNHWSSCLSSFLPSFVQLMLTWCWLTSCVHSWRFACDACLVIRHLDNTVHYSSARLSSAHSSIEPVQLVWFLRQTSILSRVTLTNVLSRISEHLTCLQTASFKCMRLLHKAQSKQWLICTA